MNKFVPAIKISIQREHDARNHLRPTALYGWRLYSRLPWRRVHSIWCQFSYARGVRMKNGGQDSRGRKKSEREFYRYEQRRREREQRQQEKLRKKYGIKDTQTDTRTGQADGLCGNR